MTDEQLFSLFQKDDSRATKVLFERYYKSVYSFFRYMGVEKEDAEDLTQEVFERVSKAKHSFHPQKAFKPWLYQIMRNRLVDFRRKHKNTTPIDLQNIELPVSTKDFKEEDFHRLKRALSALNPPDRELLLLVKYQQIRYAEVAEMLAISEGAVKTRVHRALKKITNIYNKNLQDEGL